VGAALGGSLGALGGSFAFRNTEDLLGRLGVINRPPVTVGEMLEEGKTEALIDLGISGAAAVARPILASRALIGKLFGVTTEQARQLISKAKVSGVRVGASDVGGTAPRTIVQALGVFPFTGTPARRNLAAKEAQVSARVNSLLDTLAPNATLRNELGLELTAAAQRRSGAFKRLTGRLANRFEQLAENASVKELIPTENAKELAGDLVTQLSEGSIKLTTGKQMAPAVEDRVAAFVVQLKDLPELITIKQYRGLVGQLRNLMDVVGKQGGDFATATRVKGALELDLNAIRADLLPDGEARTLVSALNTFNRTYSKGMAGFESATARRFGRVDKNIFGPGPFKAGSLSSDEIADVALNVRSRQAIDELEFVVGKGKLKEASRFHLESAFQRASEVRKIGSESVEALDVAAFRRELGLGTGKKDQSEGVSALLERAGVDVQDLRNLLDVAENLERAGDPALFVKRRVIFAGAQGLTGVLGAGASFAAGAGVVASGGVGLLTIAVGTVLARKATSIATSPVALKNMLTALDEAADTAARRMALARVLTALARQAGEDSEPKKGVRGTATGPGIPANGRAASTIGVRG
jgi:hypothetical protein